VGVAGQVPAILDIIHLARIIEVAAAGRALDRQPSFALRDRPAVLVEHGCLIAWHRAAGGAGADRVAAFGNEDVHHLGGTDAVDDGNAGAFLPGVPDGFR